MVLPPFRRILLPILLLLLLAPTVAADAAEPTDVLDWVNDRRDAAGVPRLLPADDLDEIAARHSRDMADADHLHHNPDLADEVDDWSAIAENVGTATDDVDTILRALWDSPAHRDNLLAPDMIHLGVGLAHGSGKVWLSQVFRQPTSSPYDDAGARGRRIDGGNASATSVVASSATFADADVVYLARVDDLADAVAGGILTRGPVLLVPRCGAVPASVREEIRRLDPARVTALGGPKAVCSDLLEAASGGRRASRLAGNDRYATSVAVSQEEYTTSDVVYLARGDHFADAVAGGALTDGPVLLVPSCGPIPAVVSAELDRLEATRVLALGGESAVCDTTLLDAADGRRAGRLAGPDRHATAARIALHASGGSSDRVLLARSDTFADAVIAGIMTDAPILLVPPCGTVPPVVIDTIDDLGVSDVRTIGGAGAVCNGMFGQALLGRAS